MEMENLSVYIIILLVGVVIASLILMPSVFQKNVEASGIKTDQISNRASGSVWAGDPEVSLRWAKDGNGYIYYVHALVELGFEGKTTSEITILPVILFKGTKERDDAATEITLKRGEARQVALDFSVRSSERPMIIMESANAYKCSDYSRDDAKLLESCLVQDSQKLLLKNFSFDFSTFQIDASLLPFAPSSLAEFLKIGDCHLSTEVVCPFDKRVISLKLEKEGNVCYEQENTKDCRKTEKMCGTVVNIDLTRITTNENMLERILPGSPACKAKLFAVSVDVGNVDDTVTAGKYQWRVGEDVTLVFWEKTSNPKLKDCWLEGMEDCAGLYIGEKTATIPVEGYK